MKRFLTVFLLCASGVSQLSSIGKQPAKRSVRLDSVLACAQTPLIQDVLKTDGPTAQFDLNALLPFAMQLARERGKWSDKEQQQYNSILAAGFLTGEVSGNRAPIMPTDGLGHFVKTRSFCNHSVTAVYQDIHKKNEGPMFIELDGSGWILNPNEVLAHADQFTFRSGVFADSLDVYLAADKGPVSIQFLCKSDGLHLYRVFISRTEQ